MRHHRTMRRALVAMAACLIAGQSLAAEERRPGLSGKLLLTGGVNQIEGAAGGGLVPWAVIGGYGTRGQIGGNVHRTRVHVRDYVLDSQGALIGLYDRVELSIVRQRFDTRDIGAALGLGRGFTVRQNVFGAKLRIAGDVVLDQDRWLPQLAIGVQHKRNDRGALLAAIGAGSDNGTDYYLSASKLLLSRSLLVNGTLHMTKANQFGILGFGGDRRDRYRPQLEGSIALLLDRHWALGAEYRSKPDNLGFDREDHAYDLFVAWAPVKTVSLTLAYVDLGRIITSDRQRGVYASVQLGF